MTERNSPSERPIEPHNKAAIDVEIYKAIEKLGGGTAEILAASDFSSAARVEALRKLGAKSDLLGIVGSYGDTMDDQWVLNELRRWNARNGP